MWVVHMEKLLGIVIEVHGVKVAVTKNRKLFSTQYLVLRVLDV